MPMQFSIGRWYYDGQRAYEVLDIEGARLLVRYHGETEPVACYLPAQARLAEALDGPPQSAPSPTPRQRHLPKNKRDDTTFETKETSPLIAELIRRHTQPAGEYLTHDQIVDLILGDPKGQHLIEQAIRLGNPNPPARIAGNMLDHFSARITDSTSEYANHFDRRKNDGKWAYKPR